MIQQQVEIDQPFRINAQGQIAFTSDPAQVLRNRVKTVIGTALQERVMRPDYGAPLAALLFEADDEMTTSIITTDIQRAIDRWEPGVVVQSVYPDTTDALDGIITLNVTYSAANSPLQTLSLPINTAVLYRGEVTQEERSG
jgi:hypothetical protein